MSIFPAHHVQALMQLRQKQGILLWALAAWPAVARATSQPLQNLFM
jgi:hypothetical protein